MGSGMRGAARSRPCHGAGASQHLGAHRKRGRRGHQDAGRRRGGHRHLAVSAGRAGGGDRRHRSLPGPAAATRDVHPAIREGVVPSVRPRGDRRRGGPDAAPQRRAAARDRRQRDGDGHRDSADHRRRLERHRHQRQPGLRPEPGGVPAGRPRRGEPVVRLAGHRRAAGQRGLLRRGDQRGDLAREPVPHRRPRGEQPRLTACSARPLTSEFIDEVNVITGGYMPEYGRTTGGAISAITKSGGNEFHGSVWGTFTPGRLDRSPAQHRAGRDAHHPGQARPRQLR